MNKLHIVMASNDSFFYEWLNQFVDSGAFRYFFVGHLSEEESRLYWESALFNPKHFEGIPPLRFEEVYKYCGGCMHLMGETYRMYCYSRGKIEPRLMSHVALRKLKLIEALNTQCISSELLGVMELLLASEQKCVDYNTLCKKMGKEKVDILIRCNLVHLRPCSTFSFGNDPNIIFLSLCLIRHVMCHCWLTVRPKYTYRFRARCSSSLFTVVTFSYINSTFCLATNIVVPFCLTDVVLLLPVVIYTFVPCCNLCLCSLL